MAGRALPINGSRPHFPEHWDFPACISIEDDAAGFGWIISPDYDCFWKLAKARSPCNRFCQEKFEWFHRFEKSRFQKSLAHNHFHCNPIFMSWPLDKVFDCFPLFAIEFHIRYYRRLRDWVKCFFQVFQICLRGVGALPIPIKRRRAYQARRGISRGQNLVRNPVRY